MIYKTLHRKLKIEQHYSHKNILCYTWSQTLFLYLSPVLHLATNRILNFFPCTTLVLQQTFLVTPLYYTQSQTKFLFLSYTTLGHKHKFSFTPLYYAQPQTEFFSRSPVLNLATNRIPHERSPVLHLTNKQNFPFSPLYYICPQFFYSFSLVLHLATDIIFMASPLYFTWPKTEFPTIAPCISLGYKRNFPQWLPCI